MSGPQRPGTAGPSPAYSGMGTALNQQQYLQQALQQNPQLASQITQRLQAGNVQVRIDTAVIQVDALHLPERLPNLLLLLPDRTRATICVAAA